jgi:hypothetical protein
MTPGLFADIGMRFQHGIGVCILLSHEHLSLHDLTDRLVKSSRIQCVEGHLHCRVRLKPFVKAS